MRTALASIVLVALASLLPGTQAHGLVNASELETLVLQDEASDVVTGLGLGYDLVQVYVGEAYVPGKGDGIYVHTILYGDAGDRPALDGPLTVRFTFGTDKGSFTRQLSTVDGTNFESDFDQLVTLPGDGEVEVQRGFALYPAGIGPGTVLTSLLAESLVNDELRDIAPGGVFVPATGQEVDMGDSQQVIDHLALKGPTGYASATVQAVADGFDIVVRNALKTGGQHIMVELPADQRGWSIEASGGGETKAGQNTTIHLQVTGAGADLPVNVLTDIGGRVPLTLRHDGDATVLAAPTGEARHDSGQAAPLPFGVVVFGLMLALAARRR